MKSLCKLTSDGTPINTKLEVGGVNIPTSSISYTINAGDKYGGLITAEICLPEVNMIANAELYAYMPDGSSKQIKQIIFEDGTILE